jgi:hypothetical protein
VLNVGVALHVSVSVLVAPIVTFPLHVSAWANVSGDAWTKPIVDAAVSADVSVDVTYCCVATA